MFTTQSLCFEVRIDVVPQIAKPDVMLYTIHKDKMVMPALSGSQIRETAKTNFKFKIYFYSEVHSFFATVQMCLKT